MVGYNLLNAAVPNVCRVLLQFDKQTKPNKKQKWMSSSNATQRTNTEDLDYW